MKLLRLIAAMLVSLSWASSPALADWQFTRWGMSPRQVADASGGIVEVRAGTVGDRNAGRDLGAAGSYRAAGFDFVARFYFDPHSGGLSLVTLDPVDKSICSALSERLVAVYGASHSTEGLDTLAVSWDDQDRNLNVRLVDITGLIPGQTCFLTYQPLRWDSKLGL